MPKISTPAWSEHGGSPHPITGQNDGPYATCPLGDLVGLSQFGVHLERLPPGSRSSHRHWHEAEDEFVHVISGELVLIEEHETSLRTGESAGWRAGQAVAHWLENRSDVDAVVLVVGTRLACDVVHYPDHGVVLHRDQTGRRFTSDDGSPVSIEE